MPWCPKCQSEYEDTVKVCKSCNVELVEELQEEKNFVYALTIKAEEADRFIEYLKYSGFEEFERKDVEDGVEIHLLEEDLDEAKKYIGTYVVMRGEELKETDTPMVPEEEDLGALIAPTKRVYDMDKLKDMKATVYNFFILGAIIAVFGLLNVLKIIKTFESSTMPYMLTVVGCFFIGVAVFTQKKIPQYRAAVEKQAKAKVSMVEWFENKYDMDHLPQVFGIDSEVQDEGALYYLVYDAVKDVLAKQFAQEEEEDITVATDDIMNKLEL